MEFSFKSQGSGVGEYPIWRRGVILDQPLTLPVQAGGGNRHSGKRLLGVSLSLGLPAEQTGRAWRAPSSFDGQGTGVPGFL